MIIVYIHGANATDASFNYIREHVSSEDCAINYSSDNGFERNLEVMVNQLSTIRNMFFVGHSLGGIYALHLANALPKQVLGAVTLSTPYGGSEIADYVKYFLPFNRLLRDIGSNSWPIRQASKFTIQHSWTNLVTIRGNSPWFSKPNDGVVSVESQSHLRDIELIDVNCNHYEILLNRSAVNLIKQKLASVQ